MHSMSGHYCCRLLDLQKNKRGIWVPKPLTQAVLDSLFPGFLSTSSVLPNVFIGSSCMLSLPVLPTEIKRERSTDILITCQDGRGAAAVSHTAARCVAKHRLSNLKQAVLDRHTMVASCSLDGRRGPQDAVRRSGLLKRPEQRPV